MQRDPRRTPAFALAVLAAAAAVGCGDEPGRAGSPTPEQATPTATATATQESAPAKATVVESGFSDPGTAGTVTYGAVLKNMSGDSDVLYVAVTINGLDAGGNVLATDTKEISVIPPGKEFVIGGDLDPGDEKIADLDIQADTTDSAPAQYPLPEVSRVRMEPQEFGGLAIRAQVENTLDSPLSEITDVFGIVRDADDKIVAGTYSFPPTEIQPGRRAAVELMFLEDVPGAASADVSVDNEITP
jgi:hypothetical protein